VRKCIATKQISSLYCLVTLPWTDMIVHTILGESDEDGLTLSVSNEAPERNIICRLPVQEASADSPWQYVSEAAVLDLLPRLLC
jgi:hypothetical protein